VVTAERGTRHVVDGSIPKGRGLVALLWPSLTGMCPAGWPLFPGFEHQEAQAGHEGKRREPRLFSACALTFQGLPVASLLSGSGDLPLAPSGLQMVTACRFPFIPVSGCALKNTA
jgi:hypothetical protein